MHQVNHVMKKLVITKININRDRNTLLQLNEEVSELINSSELIYKIIFFIIILY
jgi:hypothetical protein